MTERWQTELTTLRRAELPTDLWDRVGEGPRLEPLGASPRSRIVAAAAAFAVFAVAAILVWRMFAPAGSGRSLPGADVLDVPPRGEVAAVYLSDGRPVFVVHHEDGPVSVVDAFSSHVQYGIKDVVAWCPSTRHFVEVAHEARYDEFGTWHSAGPAPNGLATFDVEVVEQDVNGDPASIRVGAIREPTAGGSAPETDPSIYPEFCPQGPRGWAGETVRVVSGNTGQIGHVVAHTVDPVDVWATPAELVAAAPDGWVAVEGRLLVSPDGFVQLCAEVDEDGCRGGAIVRGLDGVGLLVNVVRPNPGWYGVEPQTWIARVEDGLLRDLGGIWFFVRD